MFYQIDVETIEVTTFEKNLTREIALSKFVCPFVNKEITIFNGQMFNMSRIGGLTIYETDRPVDSDWPIPKANFVTRDDESSVSKILQEFDYKRAFRVELQKVSKDVTTEIFQEAVLLIETGGYRELRLRLIEAMGDRYAFFICPFGNNEVDHNYEFVIKPAVRQFQFTIERADEISHTRQITDVILNAIARSKFLIADLTDARPNCYYEIGYAHALRKPVVVLAKADTERHFDISTYKWNFWHSYVDLKPSIEKELSSVIQTLSTTPKGALRSAA